MPKPSSKHPWRAPTRHHAEASSGEPGSGRPCPRTCPPARACTMPIAGSGRPRQSMHAKRRRHLTALPSARVPRRWLTPCPLRHGEWRREHVIGMACVARLTWRVWRGPRFRPHPAPLCCLLPCTQAVCALAAAMGAMYYYGDWTCRLPQSAGFCSAESVAKLLDEGCVSTTPITFPTCHGASTARTFSPRACV